jgi:hypothetical protein
VPHFRLLHRAFSELYKEPQAMETRFIITLVHLDYRGAYLCEQNSQAPLVKLKLTLNHFSIYKRRVQLLP